MTPRCRECEYRTTDSFLSRDIYACNYPGRKTRHISIDRAWKAGAPKLPQTSPRWCPRRAKNKKEEKR